MRGWNIEPLQAGGLQRSVSSDLRSRYRPQRLKVQLARLRLLPFLARHAPPRLGKHRADARHRLVSVEPLCPAPAERLSDDFHARGELTLYDDVEGCMEPSVVELRWQPPVIRKDLLDALTFTQDEPCLRVGRSIRVVFHHCVRLTDSPAQLTLKLRPRPSQGRAGAQQVSDARREHRAASGRWPAAV